jgi:hypothetical protein
MALYCARWSHCVYPEVEGRESGQDEFGLGGVFWLVELEFSGTPESELVQTKVSLAFSTAICINFSVFFL